jgi:hypothetical protein
VKSVGERVIDGVTGGESRPPPPPPPSKAAPAARSVGESTRSSSAGTSAPLSFEDLLKNSIEQKESVLSRSLTDAEKADLAAKLKKLMS